MKRSAFTLMELLVVVVIIALLAAILVSAMGGAREATRRNKCLSQQRDLTTALIGYNNANNGLPGYLNQLGDTPIHSWAVAVFPGVGETKRHEELMKGNTPAEAFKPLPFLLCPSDLPQEDSRLNYVVNCGPVVETGVDDVHIQTLSLFRDRRAELVSLNKKVKIEEIPNGASHTILLTENIDAGFWHQDWTDSKYDTDEIDILGTYTRSSVAVSNLGFMWSRTDNDYALNSPAKPRPRPSSKHPGVVMAAYADGAVKAIHDDISIKEWLMDVCVDSEEAQAAGL